MSTTNEQRLENEMAYHVSIAQRERKNLSPTPQDLVDRYQTCTRWRTRYTECVIHFLTLHKPRHICDFGCGSGEMACRLGRLGYRVTGLDVSPELIEVARERAQLEGVSDNVKFIVADGASVNLTNGAFDAVLAMSVVHHMPLDDALNALERLLCPGGRVAFLEPVAYSQTLQWLRDRSAVEKDVSPDERQLSAKEVRHIGKRFVIEDQRHFYLIARLRRLFPDSWGHWTARIFSWLDQCLLLIPGVSHFAGVIAILARKRS
ncbi:class I SAM-dependent methyltransferase [Prosthecobacter sp.]|jgi:ubiquinone/menaquinone biosynthesis C-methylase UbiE|uniref:class I SAM-dependent methyltransferase n=1 Tax=Prosthecobacter sp. TaxID=1965333 RepID=UPI0037C4F8AF